MVVTEHKSFVRLGLCGAKQRRWIAASCCVDATAGLKSKLKRKNSLNLRQKSVEPQFVAKTQQKKARRWDHQSVRCQKSTTRPHSWTAIAAVLLVACFCPTARSQSTRVEPRRPADGDAAAAAPIRIDGTVLLADDQPLFATIIQHNGEPFSFLRSIGFNTIQLRATATSDQLAEAQSLGMRIVCPPPASIGLRAIPSRFAPVIAWSVGEQTTGRDIQRIQRTVAELRAAPTEDDRPVVAHIRDNHMAVGGTLDILNVARPASAAGFVSDDFAQEIGRLTFKQVKPVWVDLQIQLPRSLLQQVIGLTGRSIELPLNHQHLRSTTYEAMAAGARGIRFVSTSRLDSADPATAVRRSTLVWLLRHVQQLQPWAAAGLAQPVGIPGHDQLAMHSLRLGDSRVYLIRNLSPADRGGSGLSRNPELRLRELAGSSNRLYRLDENGATALSSRQTSAASNLPATIPVGASTDCLLATENPALIAHVNQAMVHSTTAIDTVRLRFELTNQSLAMLQLATQQLRSFGQELPFLEAGVSAAETSIGSARQLLETGASQLALARLDQADRLIKSAEQQLLAVVGNASAANGNHVTSPLLFHSGLLPLHFQLASELSGNQWNPNSLPGGDFENLKHLTTAGWTNHRSNDTEISTSVSLSPTAAIAGEFGLQLVANSVRSEAPDGSPVSIRSAPLRVRAGQIVRIHGFVNVPRRISGSQNGLTITESLGGFALRSRVRQTTGWEEFTLYRVATTDSQLDVTFALTGFGTAMIDEVTIRTMDRSPANPQARAGQQDSYFQ